MKLLVVFLVVACAFGVRADTSDYLERIEDVAEAIDTLCVDTFKDLIAEVIGEDQVDSVCGLQSAVQGYSSSDGDCPGPLNDNNDVTVVLGLAVNCTLQEGCQNKQTGVVKDAAELLKCVLTSQNNVLSSVGQALKNIFAGLGNIQMTTHILLLIVYILLVRVQELVCSGSLSLVGISIVLPIVVANILFGVIVGLIRGKALSFVGFLVLALLPVVLLLIFIVAGVVLFLGGLLDKLIDRLLKFVGGIVLSLTDYGTCSPGENSQGEEIDYKSLIHPPSFGDILKLITRMVTSTIGSGIGGGLGGLLKLGSGVSGLGGLLKLGSGGGGSGGLFS